MQTGQCRAQAGAPQPDAPHGRAAAAPPLPAVQAEPYFCLMTEPRHRKTGPRVVPPHGSGGLADRRACGTPCRHRLRMRHKPSPQNQDETQSLPSGDLAELHTRRLKQLPRGAGACGDLAGTHRTAACRGEWTASGEPKYIPALKQSVTPPQGGRSSGGGSKASHGAAPSLPSRQPCMPEDRVRQLATRPESRHARTSNAVSISAGKNRNSARGAPSAALPLTGLTPRFALI